jgi:hypothetical protein
MRSCDDDRGRHQGAAAELPVEAISGIEGGVESDRHLPRPLRDRRQIAAHDSRLQLVRGNSALS